MSAQAVLKFIAIVEVFFPRPKFSGAQDSEAIWLRSMQDALQGCDEALLLEAARAIQINRNPHKDGKFFPSIYEIKAVVNDLAESRERATLKLLPSKSDEWSEERQNLAFDLCKSETGRRAAKEGWIAALYHFARQNQRLPADHEVTPLIETARAVDAASETWEAGNSVLAACAEFGRSVLKRRSSLANAVLSGKSKFSYLDGH